MARNIHRTLAVSGGADGFILKNHSSLLGMQGTEAALHGLRVCGWPRVCCRYTPLFVFRGSLHVFLCLQGHVIGHTWSGDQDGTHRGLSSENKTQGDVGPVQGAGPTVSRLLLSAVGPAAVHSAVKQVSAAPALYDIIWHPWHPPIVQCVG